MFKGITEPKILESGGEAKFGNSIDSSISKNSQMSQLYISGGSINIISSGIDEPGEINEKIISELLTYDIKEYINNNSNYCFYSISNNKQNHDIYNKIYKIRKIEKDKNNFIRCIIFSYLENLVLNNNKNSLKEFGEKINTKELISEKNSMINDENKKRVIDILNIIISNLIKNNIDNAYTILLKSFIFIKEFSVFLNYLTRKLIYDFIIKNKNNFLSVDEPKKICELLPKKYMQNNNGNESSFNNFLKDLIDMNFEIPHNEIYSKVIPYIFEIDLNVIVFNNKNFSDENEIKYKYKGNDNLNLIYNEKEKYFSINYPIDFYKKFEKYLSIVSQVCKQCKNIVETNNIFKLCEKCLFNIIEEDNQIYTFYLDYRSKNKIEEYTKNHIKKIIKALPGFSFKIDNKKVSLNELVKVHGMNFNKLLLKIIQKVCLICNNEVDNKKKDIITLPCNCKICSKCFNIYMEEINQRNETVTADEQNVVLPMSECFCGYEYNLKDFKKFKDEVEKCGYNEYLNEIEKAIENNLMSRCIFCHKYLNKVDRFLRLNVKDEYDHLICKDCSLKKNINLENDDNKVFQCPFCNKKHLIKSWKDFSGFSDCVIF